MLAGLALVLLLLSSGAVNSSSGVMLRPPPGYAVSNIDPTLNSSVNSQYYIPNFVPGFAVNLPNTSIYWSSGNGYAKLGYSVGPWSGFWAGLPHYAMGPQCCNFEEVPHTQQFTMESWGNHHYSRSALGPPGVNVQNYTSVFGSPPAPVGLRTDWNWTLKLSLDWTQPVLLNPENEWAAVGVAAVQYVPDFPGNLVYTLVNFWMDQNSSSSSGLAGGLAGAVAPPSLVSYHPMQLSASGNQTITMDLSQYMSDTLHELKISTSNSDKPLLTYIYLNIEGYNFRWNSTLWSFFVLTPRQNGQSPGDLTQTLLPGVVVAAVVFVYLYSGRRSARPRPTQDLNQR